MSIAEPLLATKLRVPEPLGGRMSRPALTGALRDASAARLIVVSAPAGAGKTTLLASWQADLDERRPFAWVSLDRRDNDPARFWRYALAALRTVAPDACPGVDGALQSAAGDLTELALPLLVNGLASLAEPIVLVLDDYHVIANADVHESVGFLVDHLPAGVQLSVAGRRDPPLRLARLRASAELLEIRGSDLRLRDEEAAALLNGSLQLGLAPEQVRRLRERTEGWAAGLQLAGLSLRGCVDREGYIDSFAGDDRQIVDYLMAEVLDRQSAETREFLLRTSILQRFSAGLCDAVLQRDDSARRLVELERSNMFTVALDDHREWYRYHHLFGELLVGELSLVEADELASLHLRAYSWYRDHEMLADAIAHAVSAGDDAAAAEMIATGWLELVNRGEFATLETWTSVLPTTRTTSDPRLCLARAWMHLVLGRPGEVEAEVRAAERGTPLGPLPDGSSSLESSAAMVRTSARLLLGDVAGAAQTAAIVSELEPDPMVPWRPHVTNAIGMSAFWSGLLEEAADAFAETVSAAGTTRYHAAALFALGYLAVICTRRGDWDEAAGHVTAARALAESRALGEHWVSVMVDFAAAELALANREAAEARAAVEHGCGIARRCGLRLETVYGLALQSHLARDAGAEIEAEQLHARALRQLAACPDPGVLRVWLQEGDEVLTPRVVMAADATDELSERELVVLRLLSTELSQREIGNELYVSLNTVKTHTRNIYAKLRVSSREQAVLKARRFGLLGRS